MDLSEYFDYMDEADDPSAATDLLATVKEQEQGRQFVLDALKQGKYLRSCIWLAQVLDLKDAIPLIEKIDDPRFQEHKAVALQLLKA